MPFKLILTGVTGRIGSEVLAQALRNADITSIIALVRRSAPQLVQSPKLELIVAKNFNEYSDENIDKLSGADGCIWCMTTTAGDPVLELEYPKAFATSFAPTLPRNGKAFRYLHLTGAMVEQDQSKALWMAPTMRKTKGRGELQMLEVAKRNELWETIITRPGYVVKGDTMLGSFAGIFGGSSFAIRSDELALALLDAVINGSETQVIQPQQLAKRGRQLLRGS